MKDISDLTVADLAIHPVWEFVCHRSSGAEEEDTLMAPVEAIPVETLNNRIVGTRLVLHNGTTCWAILGNIHLKNKLSTQHFMTVSIESNGQWFDLARYHDVDFHRRGPQQLAAFLKLRESDVFPIKYDISAIAEGPPDITTGEILPTVREVLSPEALIELALE
jgi:hypothetical protein